MNWATPKISVLSWDGFSQAKCFGKSARILFKDNNKQQIIKLSVGKGFLTAFEQNSFWNQVSSVYSIGFGKM